MEVKKIQKIKISSIENLIGASIKRNNIAMGCDVSMHSTGISIIETKNHYLKIVKIAKLITPKGMKVFDAIDLFTEQIEELKHEIIKKYKIDTNVIEDCFLKFNVQTLKSLARFEVLIYDRFKGITSYSELKMPSSVRKKVNFKKSNNSIKGNQLKQEIVEYVNKLFKLELKLEDNDLADAILLALSGLVE
jgi:Holliday junction resolvasome RuvABC endonuclease subunit